MLSSANTALFTLTIPSIRNDFNVLNFKGDEALSDLYSIHVEVVSEYGDFDIEDLLGKPAFLQFGTGGEGIHGRIEDVVTGEIGEHLTRYCLKLVPALHYLQLSYNQRIFQKLTLPQIITQVLQQHGMQADVFTFHVRTSEEREYCTQYDESDFEFIQRLCAEDGLAWHHQHSAERHLLVFTEDPVFFPKLGATPYRPDAGMGAEQPVVSRLSLAFNTRTSRVTRRSYDLKRPSRRLENRFTDKKPCSWRWQPRPIRSSIRLARKKRIFWLSRAGSFPLGTAAPNTKHKKWALNPGRVCPFFIRFPLCGPGILITD